MIKNKHNAHKLFLNRTTPPPLQMYVYVRASVYVSVCACVFWVCVLYE